MNALRHHTDDFETGLQRFQDDYERFGGQEAFGWLVRWRSHGPAAKSN
jgi:hypothetical protein